MMNYDMKTVAFVTYSELPRLNSDDLLAIPEMRKLGMAVEPVCWDDPSADWRDYDAVVLRSTWDYHKRIARFNEWLQTLADDGVTVFNPLDVIRWNSDKRYLIDLQRRQVEIVPTALITRERAADLPWILESQGWHKAVVKPAISASSHNTWITEQSTAPRDQAKLVAQLLEGDVLVQAFMPEVIREGEYSLVFFNKQYSHAVLKKPRAGDFRTNVGGKNTAAQPAPALIAQAQKILDLLPRPLLYARVDGISRGGQFVLMELELIEPDLGLAFSKTAPAAFAAAIAQSIQRSLSAEHPAALLGAAAH